MTNDIPGVTTKNNVIQMDENNHPLDKVRLSNQENSDLLSVAKGGGISLVGTVTTRGMSYIYNAVLIWGIGGDNFGLFTLGLTITTFASILTELGLGLGIVRFGAIYADNQSQISLHKTTMVALRLSLSIGLILLIIFFAVADLISFEIFHKPQLASLIRAFGLIIPIMAVANLLLAATRAIKIMRYTVYTETFQPFAALIIAIPMLILGMGVQALALSLVISYTLALGLAVYFYRKLIPNPNKDKNAHAVPIGQIIKFSIPLSLTKWIQYAYDRIEIIFLGLMPAVINVGIYKIAWSLAGLETMVRLSLDQILAPFSSDLSHRKRIFQLESLYKTTAKWSYTYALMLCLIITLFARPILNIFDPSYVSGVTVLVILSFAQLFNEGTGSCGTILIMSGRSDLSLINTIVSFVSSIALSWFLIPRFGLLGAGFAGAITIILVNSLRVIEVWATLKIHPLKRSFLKPTFAGFLSTAIILLLRSYVDSGTILINLVFIFLFATTYVALILIMKLDAEDIVVIRAATRRFNKFVHAG
jgi:O-antigen/teichoic acid export membrane protein